MISGSLRTPALLAALVLPVALPAQTTLTPPTRRGPGSITLFTQGPAPQSLTVSGGPAVTTIDWRPLSGAPTLRAMFYSLQRWKASDLTCCTVQWDALTTNLLFDEGAPWPGRYVYRLTAFYSNGTVGSIDSPHAPPAPDNPTGFSGTHANGVVTLAWKAVPNVSWYELSGPNIPYGSFQLAPNLTYYLVRNLPSGSHEWTIRSVYSSQNAPAAVALPSNQAPIAKVVVP